MAQGPFYRIGVWWRAARPFAYPASIVPALLGAAVAWSEGRPVRLFLAALVLAGAVLAHTGANLLADYFDYRRGQDRRGSLGGSGLLVDGTLLPRDVLEAAALSFLGAAIIGAALVLRCGPPLFAVVAAGAFLAAGYSMPPFSLKYRALGDPAVFLAFGVGITLGSYIVQTGEFGWPPVLHSIPVGLMIAAILHANNARDMDDDRAAGTSTIANLIGDGPSRWLYAAYLFGAFAVLAALLAFRLASPGAAAAFLALPLAWRQARAFFRAPRPARDAIAAADARTASMSLAFGLLMVAGIAAWRLMGGAHG